MIRYSISYESSLFTLLHWARLCARKNGSPSTPTPWLSHQWSRGGPLAPKTGGFSMEFPVDFLWIPTPNGHSIRNQPGADLASQGPSLVQPVIKPASTHHETAKHFWKHDLLWPQSILFWGSCSLATSGSRSYINLDQFFDQHGQRAWMRMESTQKAAWLCGWNMVKHPQFPQFPIYRKPSRQLRLRPCVVDPEAWERPAFSQCWICIWVASRTSRDAKEGNSGCNLFLTGKKKTCSSGMFRILNGGSFKFGPAICSHSVLANSLVRNRQAEFPKLGPRAAATCLSESAGVTHVGYSSKKVAI